MTSWSTRMYWVGSVVARRPSRRPTFPFRYDDLLITLANSHHPYGRATQRNAYLTHIVDAIFLVWRQGKLVDKLVRWRCGAHSRFFRLMDEPESTTCARCPLERPPRERRPS